MPIYPCKNDWWECPLPREIFADTGPPPFKTPIFAALRGMPVHTSYEKGVRPSICLSVRLTNACTTVTKQKKDLSTFSYHTKDHLA